MPAGSRRRTFSRRTNSRRTGQQRRPSLTTTRSSAVSVSVFPLASGAGCEAGPTTSAAGATCCFGTGAVRLASDDSRNAGTPSQGRRARRWRCGQLALQATIGALRLLGTRITDRSSGQGDLGERGFGTRSLALPPVQDLPTWPTTSPALLGLADASLSPFVDDSRLVHLRSTSCGAGPLRRSSSTGPPAPPTARSWRRASRSRRSSRHLASGSRELSASVENSSSVGIGTSGRRVLR